MDKWKFFKFSQKAVFWAQARAKKHDYTVNAKTVNIWHTVADKSAEWNIWDFFYERS